MSQKGLSMNLVSQKGKQQRSLGGDLTYITGSYKGKIPRKPFPSKIASLFTFQNGVITQGQLCLL
jgi:hypothetical protein